MVLVTKEIPLPETSGVKPPIILVRAAEDMSAGMVIAIEGRIARRAVAEDAS